MNGGALHQIQIGARGLVDPFAVARTDHANLPDGAGSSRGEGPCASSFEFAASTVPPLATIGGVGITPGQRLQPTTQRDLGTDAQGIGDVFALVGLFSRLLGPKSLCNASHGSLDGLRDPILERPHDAPSAVKPACLTTGNMTDRGQGVAFQRNPEMNRYAQ